MTSATATTRMTRDKVILDDRPCHTCGYNLKGLATGGNCPECGTHIRAVSRLHEDTLGEAPRHYLRVLSLGFLLTGTGAMVMFVGVVWMVYDFFLILGGALGAGGGPSGTGTVFRGLAFPLGSLAYAIGAFIVTRPRPSKSGSGPRLQQGRPEWGAMRRLSRISAVALAIGLGGHAIARLTGTDLVMWVSLPFAMVGLAGVIAVTAYLSNLAHWATDSHISQHVQGAGFFVAVSGVISSLLWVDHAIAIAVGIFVVPLVMIFGAALFWMSYQTLKMQSMVTWAIRNEKSRIERDARMAEKARQYAQDAAQRSGAPGAPAGPEGADPHLLDTIERQHRAMEEEAERVRQEEHAQEQQQRGHQVDDSGADPYALEDD